MKKTKSYFSIPAYGEWFIYAGGYKKEDSHSYDVYGQRWAYDFDMKIDDKYFPFTSGKGIINAFNDNSPKSDKDQTEKENPNLKIQEVTLIILDGQYKDKEVTANYTIYNKEKIYYG